MTDPKQVDKNSVTVFQLFMVVLSIYVLIALFVDSMFELSPEMDRLISQIDFIVCVIFMGDFFYRLYHAPSKWKFLRWGWIDFISSIPMLDIFRGGNTFRIIRILRLLRAFRSVKILMTFLLRNRSSNTFVTVAAITCLLSMLASMLILDLEKDQPGSNIKTASDALWWSVVTVTTVGYGDRFPVSDGGRIVAAILMTAGVGLFGTFTGFVASMFVEPDIAREKREVVVLANQIRGLRKEIKSLDDKIMRSNRNMNQFRKQVLQRKVGRNKPQPPESENPEI